jgi:hypothetical protein
VLREDREALLTVQAWRAYFGKMAELRYRVLFTYDYHLYYLPFL